MNIIDYNGDQSELELLVTFEHDASKYIIYRLQKEADSNAQTDMIFTAEISETENSFSFNNVFLNDVWNKLLRVIMKGLTSDVRIFDLYEELDGKTYVESPLRESRKLQVSLKFVDELRKLNSDDTESSVLVADEDEEETTEYVPESNYENEEETENTSEPSYDEEDLESDSSTEVKNVIYSEEVRFVPSYDDSKIELSGIEKEIGTVSEILRNIIKKNAEISTANHSLDDKKEELHDYEISLKREEDRINKLKNEIIERETLLIKKEQNMKSLENKLNLKQQQIEDDTARLNRNLEILNDLAKEVNASLS